MEIIVRLFFTQVLAVNLMKEVVENASPIHADLIPCAQYNIGRAYYEGFGVKQSDEEAERWWLRSAKDGDASGCVKSQSILAMYYSRRGELTTDYNKVSGSHSFEGCFPFQCERRGGCV